MSEHAMLIRCVYCGTDKAPIRNDLEYRDTEPWRCSNSKCRESGVREDFFILQPEIPPLKLEDIEDTVSLLNEAFEKGKREGIEEGRRIEREATVRYFRKLGKPYYVALFKEGEHLK